MASAKPTGTRSDCAVYWDGVQKAELRKVESHIFLVGADDTDQMIKHLADSDRRQAGISR